MYIGCKEAETFVKKHDIDYSLACWTLPSSIYTLWLKLRLNKPYGVWILGSDVNVYAKFPILNQLTVIALKKAQTTFSNSYWLINIVEKLSGRECKYMDAITDFNVSNVKKANLEKNVFNFMFAGSIRKVKGVDVLVRAAYYLKLKTSDFKIHILGDGPIKPQVVKYVSENNLSENVIFYGVVSKEIVASYMKSADSLVVSSRAESIPLVIVEASRVGLPTISTDVGDDRMVIERYKVGLICKNKDPEDMAKIMYEAIKEGKGFRKSRQAGLAKLAKSRSQKIAVATFLKNVN